MVQIRKMGPQIGVEVSGVDVRTLDDAGFAPIYQAWLDHNVLVVTGQELTIPEISQTVIFTRMEGRTPVPALERLGSLASHQATMAIFLSVGMIEKVRDELLQGYPGNTPVVIIEKATWPEQKVLRGALQNIVGLVKDAGIKKTALIYVGESLRASETSLGKESKLYHKDFKHEFRK